MFKTNKIARETNAAKQQALVLPKPVTLTPDQIREVAGGIAVGKTTTMGRFPRAK